MGQRPKCIWKRGSCFKMKDNRLFVFAWNHSEEGDGEGEVVIEIEIEIDDRGQMTDDGWMNGWTDGQMDRQTDRHDRDIRELREDLT